MLVITLTESIWPCIKTSLDYLVEKRGEPLPDPVKSGLNFSIVLGSACYLEGVLEALLRALLGCRRADFNRIEVTR